MKEQAQRKISVTLPGSLIDEAEAVARADRHTRSEIIALAVKQYLREKRRIELKNTMQRGYLEKGTLNLEIAEKSIASDESAYKVYEEFLSESDDSDCKTR